MQHRPPVRLHLNVRERKRDCRTVSGTVTNSVAPLINAQGSVLMAKLRSVNRGMPPSMTSHVFFLLNCLILSCSKEILLLDVFDKSMSQISFLGPEISGSLHVKPPLVLSHLLRVACQIHQSSQVPVRYRNQRQKSI